MRAEGLPIGIYTRQSIDKKDSISIETQIDFCRRKFEPDTSFEIFTDKGFSGKNTQRPDFVRMMRYVEEGRLQEICVYRLDRISRSLIDFLQMTSFFEKNNVGFSSVTEPIETNTPYGKAIMSVLMAIAELERKNIQIRVKDNYHARGKKGYFLGGPRPYGFEREKTTAPDGYKTSRYIPDENEAPIVMELYERYRAGASLAAMASDLNNRGIQTTRGTVWTSAKISFLLANPVYVKANADVYQYYQEKGVAIANRAEEFAGTRGCFIFGKKKANMQDEPATKGRVLSLGLHEGIIEPGTWLAVQKRINTNQSFRNNGKGRISWLSGIIKCGYCGYALTATKSADRKRTKEYFTFVCNGRAQAKICMQATKVKRVREIEEIVTHGIFDRMQTIGDACITYEKYESCSRKTNDLKLRLLVIEEEIRHMLDFIAKGNTTFSKVVKQRAEELVKEREALRRQMEKDEALARTQSSGDIRGYITDWNQSSLEEKKAIVRELVSRIEVTNHEIVIKWKV